MDQYERQEKQREAMRRLRTQRRRAGELRRRVVATSVVAFALLWAIVFAQMATGHDPVLSAKSSAAMATTAGSHRKTKAQAARSEAADRRETSRSAVEPTPAEVELEAFEAEAELETEALEAEGEAVEAEPEVEEFVEEPAPVTTSQS